ncbi:hypothetical protein MKSMC1_32750 [Mycobacterium kansasii]|nr:hypothetical protein MKSMC1_32750 [Mycobacterium kansasii]
MSSAGVVSTWHPTLTASRVYVAIQRVGSFDCGAGVAVMEAILPRSYGQ